MTKIEKTELEWLDYVTFWMGELYEVATDLQEDLKRFYEPEKGWPPHIQGIESPNDYEGVMKETKEFLQEE